MLPVELPHKQMPIIMLVCAALVAGVTIFTKCTQMTGAEKAVKEGSLPKLIAAINRYPDQLNKPDKDNGFTPLHWAVMGNQTNLVNFLLAKDAEVNARDPFGMTPLHKAAAFGRKEIADLLIEYNADLLAFGTKYGVIQFAPIHLAAEGGFPDLIQLFLDYGVDVNLRTKGKNEVTPLHIASAKGRPEVVELLLKAGADVNARDSDGKTPLTWAVKAEQKEVADMLRIYEGEE